tara:strand:+ start:96 stop:2621 length:2526 start_codon:yes stop_codon:yes gene_type:complete
VEIQLGLLLGYGVLAAPFKWVALGSLAVGSALGYVTYLRTQAHVKDAASLALANLLITLTLIHWQLNNMTHWATHIFFISLFMTLAYLPLRHLKFFRHQYKRYHILLLLFAIGVGYLQLGILTTWIIINIICCIYMIKLMPRAFFISILRLIFGICFRIQVHGLEHFSKHKKRIIIANHQSWLDGLILSAFLPTEMTFAVNRFTAKKGFFSYFNFLNNHVALDPSRPIALKALIEAVESHKTVVIFPEGRHTVTGAMMKIYEGPFLIAAKTGAHLFPIRIEGSQFSYFSCFNLGKRRLFPKISLQVLPPKSVDNNLSRDRYSIEFFDIMQSLMFESSYIKEHAWLALQRAYQKCGFNHVIMEDYQHKPKNLGRFLLEAGTLGHAICSLYQEQWSALLLPNSITFSCTLFGLWSQNKSAVILNYSMSANALINTIEDLGVKQLVTARKFITHQKLEPLVTGLEQKGVKVVFIDELKISLKSKLYGLYGLLFKQKSFDSQKPAVALLSSGSEKKPKTIILSHNNIMAQVAQVSNSVDFHTKDVVFNTLPAFHAFGLTIGLIAPTISGVRTFQYHNPLHYRLIPELIYGCNATILIGTNTFLREYGKAAHSYDFFNIRYIFAGGEKIHRNVIQQWIERFGIVIFEGYGTTETSPLLSINNRMYHKIGTVGRPIPGVEVKIKKVPGISEGGELMIKGPNVMMGYASSIKPFEITSMENKWYATGDIVSQDDFGFLTIHGRKRRFAKISGEMVSLEAIEQMVSSAYPGTHHAIIAEKDLKKGEILHLVTEDATITLSELRKKISKDDLNNLMMPKKVFHLSEIPKLSTGKTNFPLLNQMIKDLGVQ